PTAGAAGGGPRTAPAAGPPFRGPGSSRSHFSDQRGIEVADVVDTADHDPTIAPLEERDRRVLDLERKQSLRRPADDPVQRDLDDATVCHREHVAMRVHVDDVLDCRADPCVERGRALTAGHHVPVRLLDPPCPRLRKPLGDPVGTHALPLAEEDLAERTERLGRRTADGAGNEPRGLERTPEIAGVEAGELPPAQAEGKTAGLAA